MATKAKLTKQQKAILARALSEGGTCNSASAYAALVDLSGTLAESREALADEELAESDQALADSDEESAESHEELAESDAESVLISTGNVLESLVELGLMAKSGPGKYRLTQEGSRVAESFAEL